MKDLHDFAPGWIHSWAVNKIKSTVKRVLKCSFACTIHFFILLQAVFASGNREFWQQRSGELLFRVLRQIKVYTELMFYFCFFHVTFSFSGQSDRFIDTKFIEPV